jgi:transglutaminase-like putative cysteine protease
MLMSLILPAALMAGCANAAETLKTMPERYRDRIAGQLKLAGENRQELLAAVARCPDAQHEALGFVLANMPQRDLKTLKADYLLTNVAYACRARGEAPWGAAIPEEIFLNYVVPYAGVNERRDDWRRDFYDRFMPIARQCRTSGEAAKRLNAEAFKALKVRYDAAKRRKPHQSPYESAEIGFASCTGLSILLVDACRAVGVPARLAGTPLWTDKSGNHTWVEVWDRQWHFVGAAEPGELDRTWFVHRAAAADGGKPAHRIYAASFARTDVVFPMVWAPDDRSVFAEDVTAFYTSRAPLKFRVVDSRGRATKAELTIRCAGRIVAADTIKGEATFDLAAGLAYEVIAGTPGGNRQVAQSVRVEKNGAEAAVIKMGGE